MIKHVGSVENGRSSIVLARKGEKCDATSLLSCIDSVIAKFGSVVVGPGMYLV